VLKTAADQAPRGTAPDAEHRPAGLWRELLALPELAMFPASAVATALVSPKGSPRPVLVLPGFIGSDQSTVPLRSFLWAIGHRPHGWGIGRNIGPANHVAAGIDRLLVRLADDYREPIDIIGWSLGGVFGRMLALNRPELVRQVISMGSPIKLDRDQSNVSVLFELMGSIWKFSSTPRKLDVDRIPVPSTTIWTRSDGVVPGLACRQTPSRFAEVVEVRGSHCGLGHNGAVLRVVADRLAQPDDSWEPFRIPTAMRALYPSCEHPGHAPPSSARRPDHSRDDD
jgi:dienelactone hydrolase